jgi:CHAD domain-containing protein
MITVTRESEQKYEMPSGGAEPRRTHQKASRHPDAGEAVLAYLAAQTATLKSLDPEVRRGAPDSVHQMRVTTRRLRSALQSFPMVLREPATRQLRADLKWLGGVLGSARDIEVLSARLRSMLTSLPTELVLGPAVARVSIHYAPREVAARDAVAQALDSSRYLTMLGELDRLLAEPPLTPEASRPARDVLTEAVRHDRKRTRRRIHRARRAPAGRGRDVALHEARKAAKRARYAAEAATPTLGKRARRLAKRMKAVQSVLGDHQDTVNARAASREIGVNAHLSGENAFSFGLLHEKAFHDARHYQRAARRAWKRAASAKCP